MISTDVKQAAERLAKGELVAIPTETVYGLAASVHSDAAIARIFETKNRPRFNPLIVHIHSIDQLSDVAINIPEAAYKLANHFWPGPLTVVLQKAAGVSDLVTAGKDTVAVRMPNHPVALELLKSLEHPIVAPSANPSNRISPTSAQHVENYFADTNLMVLEGGPCTRGIESTIVGFEEDAPIVYRLGSIALEDIEEVVGPIRVKNEANSSPTGPGMLKKHYSPTTPTYLVEDVAGFVQNQALGSFGVLSFTGETAHPSATHVEVLSTKGDPAEAASKLYGALHTLDAKGLDAIVIEKLPDQGLGKSINDRLKRAANQER